jgi:hypothetical protein
MPESLRSSWTLSTWQPWQRIPAETPGLWGGIHPAYRMAVFLPCLTFVLITLWWPAPKNLAQVIALSAAVLISIQFWYANQGGIYILWYLPLLLLVVFRPNLSTSVPNPPPNDWLQRLGKYVLASMSRFLTRLFRRREIAQISQLHRG